MKSIIIKSSAIGKENNYSLSPEYYIKKVSNLKSQIETLVTEGKEIEGIQPLINDLDNLIPDNDLISFLSDAEINKCERCEQLALRTDMTVQGNDDYAILLCWHCND